VAGTAFRQTDSGLRAALVAQVAFFAQNARLEPLGIVRVLPEQVGVMIAFQQHQIRAAVGLHQRAVAGVNFILEMVEHFRQGADIGASLDGLVLSAAHFGGSHHLHRPGDLGRVFDGLDPASDVSQIAHVSVLP